MHIYPQAIVNTATTDTGATTFYKASFWDDGIGMAHTFDVGRLIKHDDHIEVKIHESKLDDSPLPADLTGYECFVSSDPDLDETFGQETIQSMTSRGRHRVYKFPRQKAISPQVP